MDEEKLKDLIRKTLVTELARIEERKKARTTQKEIVKAAKEKKRREEYAAMEASMASNSPGKSMWGGLHARINDSPSNSPTRT